jgi:hypothetical protein
MDRMTTTTITVAGVELFAGLRFADGRSVDAIDGERVAIAPSPEDAGRVFGNVNREPARRWYKSTSPTLAAIVRRGVSS